MTIPESSGEHSEGKRISSVSRKHLSVRHKVCKQKMVRSVIPASFLNPVELKMFVIGALILP